MAMQFAVHSHCALATHHCEVTCCASARPSAPFVCHNFLPFCNLIAVSLLIVAVVASPFSPAVCVRLDHFFRHPCMWKYILTPTSGRAGPLPLTRIPSCTLLCNNADGAWVRLDFKRCTNFPSAYLLPRIGADEGRVYNRVFCGCWYSTWYKYKYLYLDKSTGVLSCRDVGPATALQRECRRPLTSTRGGEKCVERACTECSSIPSPSCVGSSDSKNIGIASDALRCRRLGSPKVFATRSSAHISPICKKTTSYSIEKAWGDGVSKDCLLLECRLKGDCCIVSGSGDVFSVKGNRSTGTKGNRTLACSILQMGPSSDRDAPACAPLPSSTPPQGDSGIAQDREGSARSSTGLPGGNEENRSFAAELAEIRRLRAARYMASREAALHPTSISLDSPVLSSLPFQSGGFVQSGSRSSVCSKSKKCKTGEEEHSSEVKNTGDSASASSKHSPWERREAEGKLAASGAPGSNRPWLQPSPVASAAYRELIVIDEDEDALDSTSLIEAEGNKRDFSGPSMKETKRVAPTDALPIWEDHFDLLTWNVNGLSNEALRPRTTAVADLISTVRPAVVFLQEVVPQTLAMLRRKLGMSYFIFTPSLRMSATGIANNSANTSCSNNGDTSSGSTRSQTATRAVGSSDVQDDVGFPYFVVILLCREQMVPLTPEALCEWFPHSRMGRHMLGVVAAPVSRPDDRFLLLTSHLESLKTFHVERINQFKRCMRVLTESFGQDEDEGDNQAEEHISEFNKGQTVGTADASTVRSGGMSGYPFQKDSTREGVPADASNRGTVLCSDKGEDREKAEENVPDDNKTPNNTGAATDERRGKPKFKNEKPDTNADGDDHGENPGPGELEVKKTHRREKRKGRLREIPASVGIFGGDMNLRDSELRGRAASVSDARGQTKYRPGHSKSSQNAFRTGSRTKKTRKSEETEASARTSHAPAIVKGDSLLLPGVEDVWEYLGCPADVEFTWDMLRNDTEQGGKIRSRLRFDRLYWYSVPASAGDCELPERCTGRSALAPVRLCNKRGGDDTKGGVACGGGGTASRVAAISDAHIPAEKVETMDVLHRASDRCDDTRSVRKNEKEELRVMRWTWKPESLHLVGTHRLPSCGRFPSDHFGLLAKFRRQSTGETLPVFAA